MGSLAADYPVAFPVGLALAGVVLLVTLVTRFKVNAFIALFAAALAVGWGAGAPLLEVVSTFQTGLGATLGSIAAVIALGVILGKLLAESGGADVLAERFAEVFGPGRIIWCVTALAFVVGLATWFAVGLLLLIPVIVTLTRRTGRPFALMTIPMLAALSVTHGLFPPHPGPVVAVETLGADMGMVILWGFVIGIPVVLLAGPLFARLAARTIPTEPPSSIPEGSVPGDAAPGRRPGFGLTLLSVLLPIALMVMAGGADLWLPEDAPSSRAIAFFGHPVVAMLIAVAFAHWSLGLRCGFRGRQLLKFTEDAAGGIGMVLLVVGAGGGFARVLVSIGAADAIGSLLRSSDLSPLVAGWLVAAFIRVATGSATVAITTASGILAPILPQLPDLNRELLVISLGSGSLFLSHLNDGGFWIVKECLGLSVIDTLKTWTVCETIIGIAGLGLTLVASALL